MDKSGSDFLIANDRSVKRVAALAFGTEEEQSVEEPRTDQFDKGVLTEDEYQRKLSAVIQRDFFPDLPKLRQHTAYHQNPIECEAAPKLSLDSFQRQFTSEDNASFTQIVAEENAARKQKFSYLYDQSQNRLTMPLDNLLDNGTVALIKQSSDDADSHDAKSNRIRTWPSKLKNDLIWYPQGKGSVHGDKVISAPKLSHANTRISSDDLIDVLPDVNSPANLDTSYSLVSSTPSPMPLRGGATPVMTWGEIDTTPVLLNDSHVDAAPMPASSRDKDGFYIPELPARSVLSKKLSDQASKSLRQKQQSMHQSTGYTSGSSASSKSDRFRMLSPAAKNLLLKRTATSSPMIIGGSSSTPSRRLQLGIVRTPTIVSGEVQSHSNKSSSSSSSAKEGDLTDNLLHI